MNSEKTAIITGAYGDIGKAIARNIASRGYRTILVGRDEIKLKKTRQETEEKTGNSNVIIKVADLSGKRNIIDLAAQWHGPLNLLVNNAASSPRSRTETPEGIEFQFATNVLGYFWMIKYFSEFMKDAEDARIVNVASYWAGGLDLNDLEFKKRKYDNDSAYRQAKQADRMLTVAFSQRLKPFGIKVNSCHPGDVNSKLSNDLGFGGHESPDEGASTPVWLATDPLIKNLTGKYFEHHRETECIFSRDMTAVERLYQVCEAY